MGRINNSVVPSDDEILSKRGYKLDRVLGEGSYSKVKSALWKKPGSNETLQVAIKIINRTTAPQDFIERFWPRERDLMEVLQHDNVIQMFDIFSEANKIYMSLERATHGDLLDYVQLKGRLGEQETHKYFSEMCNGIKYLHGLQIVHRDLKCENMLLTAQNSIKIADFGFARKMSKSEISKTFCGSAAYAAPEVLRGVPYEGTSSDIWSLGVILFIMACALMPFRDTSLSKILKDQKNTPNFPEKHKLNKRYCHLVTNILRYDLKKRFSLQDILHHDWLTTIYNKPRPDPSVSSTDSGIESDRSLSIISSELSELCPS
nr:testis-specific serine/threonine-protein kinase 3-like [Ciona intestinalis]|eukprot:XP_009858398.1 testis-specific serine/threonine-protein kinase 3-like [Ciona intestinalis]